MKVKCFAPPLGMPTALNKGLGCMDFTLKLVNYPEHFTAFTTNTSSVHP